MKPSITSGTLLYRFAGDGKSSNTPSSLTLVAKSSRKSLVAFHLSVSTPFVHSMVAKYSPVANSAIESAF
jgi:hypothetical protein